MTPDTKDDRRDALALADIVRTDAHCLREWSCMSDDLTKERTRLATAHSFQRLLMRR